MTSAHSNCNNAYQPVRCDRCGREYICTPSDDFYCAAEGDHCCERCLLSGAGVTRLFVVQPTAAAPQLSTERS